MNDFIEDLQGFIEGWSIVSVEESNKTESYFDMVVKKGSKKRSFTFHATELGAWVTSHKEWHESDEIRTYADVTNLVEDMTSYITSIEWEEFKSDEESREIQEIFDEEIEIVCDDKYRGFKSGDQNWCVKASNFEDYEDAIIEMFKSKEGLDSLVRRIGCMDIEYSDEFDEYSENSSINYIV